jgi:hypothetical protein
VLTMAYAVGHFNCAVTIGLWACSRARPARFIRLGEVPGRFPGLRVIATHQLGRYRR